MTDKFRTKLFYAGIKTAAVFFLFPPGKKLDMAKKICASGTEKLENVMGFTFPRLHEGKEWYIDFKAFDPESGELRRKKYYVPKQGKKTERRAMAAVMVERLTQKLREGWTPYGIIGNISGTNKISDMLNKYLAHIKLQHRKKTIQSYSSRVNVLREYMKTLLAPPKYCYQYTRTFVVNFLDWIIEERGGNARTRNNYLQWCGVFGEFLIDRECINENPAATIKKLKEGEKIRQPLSGKQLAQLNKYLMKKDRYFLLACMMEYYTFVRPNELRHVRIRDISVMEQTVFIPAEVSKNRKDGKAALNADILQLMIELKVLEKPGDWYLFGPDLLPSPEQANPDIFNRSFLKVRKALKFPSDIKFYSLKDSGIRDLSEKEGVVTARDQARHSDIATTNRYLQGRDSDAPGKAKRFSGALHATEEFPLEDS